MSMPPSRFQKKIKVSTPVSESKNIRITNEDKKEFARMIKASVNSQYLSPLGKKMIKESLDNEEPIDLEDINRRVVTSDLENVQAAKHKSESQPTTDVSVENQEIDSWKETSDEEKEEKGDNEDEVKKDTFNNGDRKNPPAKNDKEGESMDMHLCLDCGLIPCEHEEFGDLITKCGKDVEKRKNGHHKAIQYYLYKVYIVAKYGTLGKGVRMRVPFCVENHIQSLYPDPRGEYTGFQHSGTTDNLFESDAKKEDDLYSSSDDKVDEEVDIVE